MTSSQTLIRIMEEAEVAILDNRRERALCYFGGESPEEVFVYNPNGTHVATVPLGDESEPLTRLLELVATGDYPLLWKEKR